MRIYPIRVIRNKEFSLIYNPNFKAVTSNLTLSGVLAGYGYPDAKRNDSENQISANSFFDMKDTSPWAMAVVHKINHRPELELYHLKNDPYELKNKINNPEYKNIAEAMKTRLLERLAEWGDSDPIATEQALLAAKNYNKSTSKDKMKAK
jgi:N-sulfoglucosamine sulfohydrolase